MTSEQASKKSFEWNERVPTGTVVRYYPIKGRPEFIESKTRSLGWPCCGSVLVKIEGKAGGVNIEHVEVVSA